jgi:hypothetical protein
MYRVTGQGYSEDLLALEELRPRRSRTKGMCNEGQTGFKNPKVGSIRHRPESWLSSRLTHFDKGVWTGLSAIIYFKRPKLESAE